MEKTPITKEEIALELIKYIAPGIGILSFSSIDGNAEKIANAYNKILATISTPQSK